MARISDIILIFIVNGINVLTYEYCNQTIEEDHILRNGSHMTLHMRQPHSEDVGRPLYCWFRFHATPPNVIQVQVRDVRTGVFEEHNQRCNSGSLQISDSEACSTKQWWFPPTELCGQHPLDTVRVKRVLRSSSALVEFRSDKLQTSDGYEFDVRIIDKVLPEERHPYGHYQRHLGRIPDTKCDWVIPVDECFASCSVVSPGWPGIYPPNTRCQYLLTNFEDARVELRMGGRLFSGKFDMRKSPNCTEDYIEVYDGMSTVNPLIGRWCGNNGYHVISTGTSLLLVFQSRSGGPKWNYSGFNVKVHDRWKDHHKGGERVTGTLCDWLFESRDSEAGSAHSPDHMTKNVTICKYEFKVTEGQRIELELRPRKLLPDCQEYVEILNGNGLILEKICAHNLTRRRQEFKYNITTNTASVKYYNLKGQRSNPDPVWVYYKFKTDEKKVIEETTQAADHHKGGERVTGTLCDWSFESRDSEAGSAHSPDHMTKNVTICKYEFKVTEGQRIELELRPRKLLPDCQEYVEILNGNGLILEKICAHNLTRRRQEFKYNITTNTASVKYYNLKGQRSNPDPVWVYYKFKTDEKKVIEETTQAADHHKGGERVTGTLCDWSFESRDSEAGSAHSPDHMTKNVTICKYEFKVTEGQRIELELRPRKLLPDCQEYVEILNGNGLILEKICAHNLTRRRQEFKYNITTNTASVKYYNLKGQRSNPDPVWVYYKFKTDEKKVIEETTQAAGAVIGSHGWKNSPNLQLVMFFVFNFLAFFITH